MSSELSLFYHNDTQPSVIDLLDNDEYDNEYHYANQEEIDDFREVVGTGVVKMLNELRLPLVVDDDYTRKKMKLSLTSNFLFSEAALALLGRLNPRYARTDYVVLFGDRVIEIITWQRLVKNSSLPEKVVQLDFMHIESWLDDDVTFMTAYQRRQDRSSTSGSGLHTEAREFLKTLRMFAEVIDPSCRIQVAVAEHQRKRIFQQLLGDLPNVSFIG